MEWGGWVYSMITGSLSTGWQLEPPCVARVVELAEAVGPGDGRAEGQRVADVRAGLVVRLPLPDTHPCGDHCQLYGQEHCQRDHHSGHTYTQTLHTQ